MQINCPCCGNAFEIESEPIVGQHVVCPFCSGKFSYADAGNQNEDRHRGDVLEYLHKKIVIRCPECGTEYEIDNDAIGSKCQCGICNRDFIARDDSSVEIGEAQERDGIAGTGVLDVEDKDDSSEQSGKELPTKERSAFFTQTFLLVVKAKNRISALWKLGVGRISVILTKERMNAVCLKAKEISSGTKNQIVRLWKSGMKGKALLCALAALVVWLGFFLMCGGGPKAGDVKTIKLPGGATMELVYCPPGTFMMGSPASEEGRSEDETQHQVTLTRGFWIGKYEVTQEQWESVMGNNPSKGKRRICNPVECVSWYDCREFCHKVGGGCRIPTEAEWEYACRAGAVNAFAGTGNPIDMREKESCEHQKVGQKMPNAWGIYDMHGNVEEWCFDCYGDYSKGLVLDPIGAVPQGYSPRVLRGGCNGFADCICRSASRMEKDPNFKNEIAGLRIACVDGSPILDPNFIANQNLKDCDIPSQVYKLGDACDFGNPSFVDKKGIVSTDIAKYFDQFRGDMVYRYSLEKIEIKDGFQLVRLSSATEESKTIVEVSDVYVYLESSTADGSDAIMRNIFYTLKYGATCAYDKEIVAASSNIRWKGLGRDQLFKEMQNVFLTTYLSAIHEGTGSFGIQWKDSGSTFYALKYCIRKQIGADKIIVMSLTHSNSLIQDEMFGSKRCELKVSAEAEFERGRCFAKGDGVNKDMHEAVKWYRKAAERGYAPAQFSLGCCYHSGHGVDKNSAEAVKWIRKAAEQGIAVAQSYLAICYEQGDGVSMDKQESLKWYRKAADGGHAHSQYILGLCYWSGDGLIQNSIEAEKWLVKAAEQGHAEAQYTLGKFYGLSDGGPRNTTEAIKWLRKASNQGHKGAKVLLDILVK